MREQTQNDSIVIIIGKCKYAKSVFARPGPRHTHTPTQEKNDCHALKWKPNKIANFNFHFVKKHYHFGCAVAVKVNNGHMKPQGIRSQMHTHTVVLMKFMQISIDKYAWQCHRRGNRCHQPVDSERERESDIERIFYYYCNESVSLLLEGCSPF